MYPQLPGSSQASVVSLDVEEASGNTSLNAVTGLDTSMTESPDVGDPLQVMARLEPAVELAPMEEMDSSHNISHITDSDAQHSDAMADMVTSGPSQPMTSFDPNDPSAHISGIGDSDSAYVAGIPTSESHQHTLSSLNLTGDLSNLSNISVLNGIDTTALSMLNGVDPAMISEMVTSGAAQLSIIAGHPDTLTLVATGDGTVGLQGLVSSGQGGDQLTLPAHDTVCKTEDLDESGEKLTDEKITLHLTSGNLAKYGLFD